MSIQTVKMLAPVINVKQDVEMNHVVNLGCQRYTPQVLTAQSWQSVGPPIQSSFVYNPPSLQSITDRKIFVRSYLEIETNQALILGLEDCLRQFPVNSIIDVTTVSVNGESISENSQSKLHALLCYGNTPEERTKSVSVCPAQPDQFQQYSAWTTEGSARNVAAYYGEVQGEMSRGSFPVQVLSPTKIRVVCTEPIFISPLNQGFGPQVEGFVNVNELTVNLRYSSNVARVLSHSTNGNPITSVTVTFYQSPELLLDVYTPALTQPIPQLQILPYVKLNEYVRTMDAMLSGASQTVFSDTIRLSVIPKYIYLFARRSDATSTFSTCDSFPSIESVNISWGNSSGLLAGASKQTLFEISRRNGCNLSWVQWSKQRGSVLCIEMSKDIGLEDFEAPNVNGAYTFQTQITFSNQSSGTMSCQFYVVTANQGVFSIAPNSARASLGGITPEQVLAARNSPEVVRSEYEQLHGGSFWTTLKGIIHKVSSVATPILSQINPAFGAISSGINQLTAPSGSGLNQAVMSSEGGRRIGAGMLRRRR